MRLAITALVMALGLGLAAGCPGPYSGKPEKLSKPRKKKKPEPTAEEAALAADKAPVFDEKCRTNFFDPPISSRKVGVSKSLTKQADSILVEAEDQEGAARISSVKEALSKLRNALSADPYGPEATYKMAVAYAMVGKKGCAIALLERLQALTKHPDAGPEAERVINRALRDQSFDPFRKNADQAMGR